MVMFFSLFRMFPNNKPDFSEYFLLPLKHYIKKKSLRSLAVVLKPSCYIKVGTRAEGRTGLILVLAQTLNIEFALGTGLK